MIQQKLEIKFLFFTVEFHYFDCRYFGATVFYINKYRQISFYLLNLDYAVDQFSVVFVLKIFVH